MTDTAPARVDVVLEGGIGRVHEVVEHDGRDLAEIAEDVLERVNARDSTTYLVVDVIEVS